MISLTQKERDRFATYLEQEAHSDEGLAKQAETLGAAGAAIAKKLRTDAAVQSIVARKLRSIESQEIDAGKEEGR